MLARWRNGITSASRAKGSRFNSWSIYLVRTVSLRGVDFKLCLPIDTWVAAAQVLVTVDRNKSQTTPVQRSIVTHIVQTSDRWRQRNSP
jgi:hypothetical protein